MKSSDNAAITGPASVEERPEPSVADIDLTEPPNGLNEEAKQSLNKISQTLDTLTESLTRLTGSMGAMTKDMNNLKRKQDFLEASWRDPDFDFSYNSKEGGFSYTTGNKYH